MGSSGVEGRASKLAGSFGGKGREWRPEGKSSDDGKPAGNRKPDAGRKGRMEMHLQEGRAGKAGRKAICRKEKHWMEGAWAGSEGRRTYARCMIMRDVC